MIDLKLHRSKAHEVILPTASYNCNSTGENNVNLKTHVDSMHGAETLTPVQSKPTLRSKSIELCCKKCPSKFNSVKNLNSHNNEMHSQTARTRQIS